MSRIEDNKKLIERLDKIAKELPGGSYEEVTAMNLGAIATLLTDISRSLAIMADKVEPKEKATVAAESQNDDLDKSDELDEKQIKELKDDILNALKESVETKIEIQRGTKYEILQKLKNEILECQERAENEYDRGRNYGCFMAAQLIEKQLKEVSK